ncbi:MAG TPA: hypothetical protein VKR56_00660 [Candidatus Cybelea sp.]|nr:hypothetical protein [Candidatus Cybelea sp.]
MDIAPMLLNSIWAGLFAAALAVVLTAPAQAIVPSLLCGFAARFIRNVLIGWGLSSSGAVVVAAAGCVLLAIALTSRRRGASVIAIVTGVLPLGAAVALFNSIKGVLNISGLKEQALITASAQLAANLSAVFTTTFAMALGIGLGFLIARFFGWGKVFQNVPKA